MMVDIKCEIYDRQWPLRCELKGILYELRSQMEIEGYISDMRRKFWSVTTV